MSEKQIKETEIIEATCEEVAEKPYTFRRFSSTDMFPMFRIIGKIGLKEFTAAIDKDALNELVSKGMESSKEEGGEFSLGDFAVGGTSVILGIADVIFSKLPYCENDIYQILSQTSNLSFDEVKKLDGAVFLEMVIDFIKKDDFKDFIKVVSKLFK